MTLNFLSPRYSDPTPTIWWYTAYSRTKARFIRTYLGSFWIGLSNLLAVSVLGLVYKFVFSVTNFSYYYAYLAFGLTLWSFVSGCPLSCGGVFQASRDRSLNSDFTPSFFFLEEFCFQLLSFVQALIPVLIVTLLFKMTNIYNIVLSILPVLNIFLAVFSLSAFTALIGAKYKDIGMLFPVVFQLMFLTSPIMFYREAAGRAYIVSKYNPIYRLLNSARSALLDGYLSLQTQFLVFPLLIILAFVSYRYIVSQRNRIILWY